MALPVVDEAENRTRLANVAQFGAAGANMPTQAAPVDPRQGAIDAALARGSQIGAPMAVQDQIGGRIGGVYDAGAQGLGAIRSANGGAVGGINAAASEYERQVALAAPIEEGRNKVAIQKILDEQRRGAADNTFRDKQFDFDKRKFDFEEKTWLAEHPDDPSAGAIDLQEVGRRLDYSPSKVQSILASPQYQLAKPLITNALTEKMDYDEFKGLVESWKETNVDNKLEGDPTIDGSTASFLINAYGDQFKTPAQKAAAPKSGGAGAGPTAKYDVKPLTVAERSSTIDAQTIRPEGNGVYQQMNPQANAVRKPVADAINKLNGTQRAVLFELAKAAGIDVVSYVMRNPEIIGDKSLGS